MLRLVTSIRLRTLVRAGVAGLIALTAQAAIGTAGATAQGSGALVTIVARECPTYTSITANRARNDIQESLRDLGKDTPYSAGQAIEAKFEADNQPLCKPLVGWDFTIGTSYRTRAVAGPWGSLSIVTNPYDEPLIRTESSVPELDSDGTKTGRTIAGATTIELTLAQATRAAAPSRLWIQGGTPDDPILYQRYPDEYGFGALRCAIDNLNGDNVEWISYPTGARHVFCFAYYVKPPPSSGTIVIRKETSGAASDQTFALGGNLSFDASGEFTLTANDSKPASKTFYRAETRPVDPPWRVREQVPDGWKLESLECESASGESTTEISGAQATIELAAADVVTCTYRDGRELEPGSLLILKETIGGVGTFDFQVKGEDGAVGKATATTEDPRVEVAAEPAPMKLSPGEYRITEQPPNANGGRWVLASVVCDGERRDPREPIEVTVTEGGSDVCTFRNVFIPRGSLAIDKVTEGGIGTAGFVISPKGHPSIQLRKQATTTRTGVPVRATGFPTERLPLGGYVIQETARPLPDQEWALTIVRCNGEAIPFSEGAVTIKLTRKNPSMLCEFTNVRQTRPGPPPPGPPLPPGPEPGDEADLVLTKRANTSVVEAGGLARYSIVVHNRGPATAEDVVVSDQVRSGFRVRSAKPSQGSCDLTRRTVTCELGSIAAGRSATVKVGARVPHRSGNARTHAVVGSSTQDPNHANNAAAANVSVSSPAPSCRPGADISRRC